VEIQRFLNVQFRRLLLILSTLSVGSTKKDTSFSHQLRATSVAVKSKEFCQKNSFNPFPFLTISVNKFMIYFFANSILFGNFMGKFKIHQLKITLNLLIFTVMNSTSKTVVNQYYNAGIMDQEYVMRGNSAIIKCSIPSFVADFVYVVAWIDSDGQEFLPPTDESFTGGKQSNVLINKLLQFLFL
jgi:hypothetical protein